MGSVFREEQFVANLQYRIRVFENYSISRPLDGSAPSKVPGVTRIELGVSDQASFRVGDSLTLRLVDGRKLDFLVLSDGGRLGVTGSIY